MCHEVACVLSQPRRWKAPGCTYSSATGRPARLPVCSSDSTALPCPLMSMSPACGSRVKGRTTTLKPGICCSVIAFQCIITWGYSSSASYNRICNRFITCQAKWCVCVCVCLWGGAGFVPDSVIFMPVYTWWQKLGFCVWRLSFTTWNSVPARISRDCFYWQSGRRQNTEHLQEWETVFFSYWSSIWQPFFIQNNGLYNVVAFNCSGYIYNSMHW